jgi:hypothetical protein
MKKIKNKQINRLPKSVAPVVPPRGASASRVAAKLDRIRTMVMNRRNQRSEVCNEIRMGINMDIPLMPVALCMFVYSCPA